MTVSANRDLRFDGGVRLGLTDSAQDVETFLGMAFRR